MSVAAGNLEPVGEFTRLGDRLIQAGLLTSAQLDFALQKQQVTGERLGELLLRLGIIFDYELANFLAEQRGIPFRHVYDFPVSDKHVLGMFNQELCLRYGFLPVQRKDGMLDVLLGNAELGKLGQIVSQRSSLRPRFFQGEFGKVAQAIRQNYYFVQNPVEDLIRIEIERLSRDVDQVYSPEVLLDHLLTMAVHKRATDIHFQPEKKSIHVFFRLDGVLQPVLAMPLTLARLLNTIKMRAEMDISDQRRPMDGSFSATVLHIPHDIRVSTVITEFGEHMVLRLLSSGSHVRGLFELGFLDEDVRRFSTLFSQPSGMILLTGPTGSGKSTTLHAGLRLHGLGGRSVLTVEDPIEYKLPVICQTEVNRKAGYTFDQAVRQFLRHDPDIMLIGEIRDVETAVAAVTAAETGHLVLSTLHVNSVLGAVPRLEALGVSRQMIADSLIGVVSQRLMRRICPACSESYKPDENELKHLSGGFSEEPPGEIYRGKGCSLCNGTGYNGRLPVYEMMMVGRDVANAIALGASRAELANMAMQSGMVAMRQMARMRVLRGETTVDEMLRVLGVEIA